MTSRTHLEDNKKIQLARHLLMQPNKFQKGLKQPQPLPLRQLPTESEYTAGPFLKKLQQLEMKANPIKKYLPGEKHNVSVKKKLLLLLLTREFSYF